MSSTEMVKLFESHSTNLVDNQFPHKTVSVGKCDLPYFTEELMRLKRKRQRAYRKGKRSHAYIESKSKFDAKLLAESIRYRNRILKEVK